MSYTYSDYYLAHHGVKGMKWGVRRYQNEDGSLTEAGKKRYADDGQGGYRKISRKERLYERYKTLGYTDEQAAKAAKGRVAAERTMVAIGATVATAAAAYAGYRWMDTNRDRIIRPDQIMQTVHKGDTAERLKEGNPFYATYDKKDHTIYASKVFSHFGEDSKVTKFYTKEGIKVASEKSGRQVFDELVKTNPEFADYAQRVRATGRGKKNYWGFNYSLVLRNESDTAKQLGLGDLDHDKMHNLFYNKLREKGYGAVIDINDSKDEGFTFNPVIVFDRTKKHVVSSTKATAEDLGSSRLAKGLAFSKARHKLLHPVSTTGVVLAGAGFLDAIGLVSKNRRETAAANYVEQYKKDHPGTTLSNKEIADMYNRNRTGRS